MPSHNLASIKIDDLEIIGYSVAGEETVVAIPQLDVCFDIGKAPDQIIPINHIQKPLKKGELVLEWNGAEDCSWCLL